MNATTELLSLRVCRWLARSLLLLLVVEALVTLRWRMNHDAPILYYVAMLVDKYGYVPYRDVFETSFPGTILFYTVLVKAVGYSDLAFRIVDLLWLSALLAVTVLLLQRFGRTAALMSAALFGLTYLGSGSMMSMQREYIALLPIALALYVATRHERHNSWQELALIGGCFGFAAAIKPQLALGIIPVLVYVAVAKEDSARGMAAALKQIVLRGLQAATGFVLVAAIPFVWVWQRGGLPAFLDIANHYLPMYLQLNGDRVVMTGFPRLLYVLKEWRMSYAGYWMGATAGFLVVLQQIQGRTRELAVLLLLVAELLVYSLCPALAGQFWSYHWLPFLWCSCVCAGLLFMVLDTAPVRAVFARATALVLLLYLAMTMRPLGNELLATALWRPMPVIKEGRVETTVNFLRGRVAPGDMVQSFDSASGSIHALLLLRLKLATPFICDCYFYDHVSNPYMQQLRTRFVDGIRDNRPRFIVDSLPKLRPLGPDTSTSFPALEQLLQANYRIAYQDSTVLIYERKP